MPTEANEDKTIDDTNDDTKGKWRTIRNIYEIFETILDRNSKMQSKSNKGTTSAGSFATSIGHSVSNECFIYQILEGKNNIDKYSKHCPDNQEETAEII